MIPALVVGCGAIGSDYDQRAAAGAPPRSHAGAYTASARTELVGGVDPDPVARERFAERWHVPCHASLAEALASSAPAVTSVCTPPGERTEIVETLVEHGVRAIWIEKPLAQEVAAAESIVAACARAGVPLQVNFSRRFDRLHQRVAARVHGRVLHADFRFSGTLENYGSHAIDLYRWFVGEPVHVSSSSSAGHQLIQVATDDGRSGTFMRVEGTRRKFFDCDLWLDDGRVVLSALGEQLVEARIAPSPLFTGLDRLELGPPDGEVGLEQAMSAALDALLDHLELGTPLRCTGADGVAELRLRERVAA